MNATAPAGHRSEPTFADLFTPKLITVLREGYGLDGLRADAVAGLTVAIVALPLSMAIAIGAGLSPERLAAYFEQVKLVALTENTVIDRTRLERLIAETRRNGYSAVEDELAYGVVAVAVPVVNQAGRVVAALNSSSHSRRIGKAKLVRERLPMLRHTSEQISRELTHLPGLTLSTPP